MALAIRGRVLVGIALGFIASFTVGTPAFAQTPLPPGTSSGIPVPTIVTGTPPFGDTLLQEVQSPIFGTNGTNTISGTVTSAAFLNVSGFLDFAYQFAFDSSTTTFVNAISISSFTNVVVAVGQTDEDVDGPGGLPAQRLGGTIQNNFTLPSASGDFSSANRPNINGDDINATMRFGVTANQRTFAFVVRTEATEFTLAGSASAQGGGISGFTAAQGIITAIAPEPTALSLMVLGMAAWVAGGMRRKSTV